MSDGKNKSNREAADLCGNMTSAYGTSDCKSRFLPTIFLLSPYQDGIACKDF
jgi:hypothetical protein